MKTLYKLVVLGILTCACSSSNQNVDPTFTYPMGVGSKWVYSFKTVILEDEGNLYPKNVIDTTTRTVQIEKDSVINDTLTVKVFSTKRNIPNLSLYDQQLKYIDKQGVRGYANNAIMIPQQISTPKSKDFMNIFLNKNFHLTQGTNGIEMPPTLEYQLPYKVGNTWAYRDGTGALGYYITKTITGRETIMIKNEALDCYKIEWKYIRKIGETDIIVREWLSKIGLVKTEIEQSFIYRKGVTNPNDPIVLAKEHFISTTLLESYSIK